MLDYKIKFTSTVLSSEAKGLFAEALGRGVEVSEHPDFLSSVGNSSEAVYAVTDKGEVVGVICYRVLELVQAAALTLVYVEESSRRLGVFTHLYTELVAYLERLGALEVHVDVPGEQQLLCDIIESRGAVISTYRYVLEIGSGDQHDSKHLGTDGKRAT